MGEDESRGGSGEDRISGLPDEVLHDILVRLRSAAAAARTSVLSRRWRHVWAHLPELHLVAPRAAASAPFVDTVDGALAGYLAPTLGYLSVSLQERDDSITAGRVAPWLQFAAEHMAGEIQLNLPLDPVRFPPSPPRLIEPEVFDAEAVLELPPCEGAKRIELDLRDQWWLRLQASGMFTALTSLKIMNGSIRGSELTSLVCTQCPCLRDLTLLLDLIVVSDISFHSTSLYSLEFCVGNTRRLEVVAPKLEELRVSHHPMEAHISAPKLAVVVWSASVYAPKQFDEVDELRLRISISEGVAGYESFLNETNKLPKCKNIRIFLTWDHHALVPSLLHLLKRCNSTKKISVLLLGHRNLPSRDSCPPSCPCRLEDNHKLDGIALSSLEEVEISYFIDSLENMELVEFLSCNAAILKTLVINYTLRHGRPLTKEVCEKVRGICHANVEVKFNVFRCGRLVPFD